MLFFRGWLTNYLMPRDTEKTACKYMFNTGGLDVNMGDYGVLCTADPTGRHGKRFIPIRIMFMVIK